MTDVKDTPAVARLRATLSKTYRIQIADGRSFMGSLCLLDKEKNIILSDTLETTAEGGVERDVGMVSSLFRPSRGRRRSLRESTLMTCPLVRAVVDYLDRDSLEVGHQGRDRGPGGCGSGELETVHLRSPRDSPTSGVR